MRQMSNLVKICEELEKEEEEEDEISTSSGEEEDNDPAVLSEVQATLAVGVALNVNLLPNDRRILKKMIRMEKEGEAGVKEKSGGRGGN